MFSVAHARPASLGDFPACRRPSTVSGALAWDTRIFQTVGVCLQKLHTSPGDPPSIKIIRVVSHRHQPPRVGHQQPQQPRRSASSPRGEADTGARRLPSAPLLVHDARRSDGHRRSRSRCGDPNPELRTVHVSSRPMIWLLPAFPLGLTLVAVGLRCRATALFGDVVRLHCRPHGSLCPHPHAVGARALRHRWLQAILALGDQLDTYERRKPHS